MVPQGLLLPDPQPARPLCFSPRFEAINLPECKENMFLVKAMDMKEQV